jgi:membrane protein
MEHVRQIAEAARRAWGQHLLATHSAAIAFRALVALVPMTLLGFALLGVFGLEDVWRDSLAPALRHRLTGPVFDAIDYSVRRIFADDSLGLIAFASALLLWQLSRGVGSIGTALNGIHETEDRRPPLRRVALDVALGFAVGVTFVASVLIVSVVPRLVGGGAAELLLKLAGILVSLGFLSVAVGLLIRYAPAEHPPPGWASAGSAFVVISWMIASLAFGWWAGSVADYRTASGTLLMFLVLTAYVQASSAIFLIGVELDELARAETEKKPARSRRRRGRVSASRG